MSNHQSEDISAGLDDELPPDRLDSLILQLTQDRGQRDTWDRYHLIGDVMRGEGVRMPRPNIADLVREKIAGEPPIISVPPRPARRWTKPAAGAALAASVAVATVLSLPRLAEQVPMGEPSRVAVNPVPINAVPVNYREPTVMRWKNLAEPGVASKLDRYLQEHSEYASPIGLNGVPPYTSFVSYDSNRP